MKHKQLKFGTLLLLILGLTSLNAQETILASGSDASGSGGSSSYSVGQVIYTINTGTPGSVAHGVQQPYEISDVSTGIEEAKGMDLLLSVYPNPATEYLILKVDNIDLSALSFQLFDITGKLLQNKRITSNETIIDMNILVPSTYFLKVIQSNEAVKTFKIIKN
jgi:hypothetical protein